MIDRDQLREALAWYDRPPGLAKPPYLDRLVEAARLVADSNTLVISKVDGEWPEWFRMLADVDQIDALLEGQPK